MPEEDLAVFPRRLRAAAIQWPMADTAWPPQYIPDVLRVLARAGRTVQYIVLLSKVGGGDPHSGEFALHKLSEWTSDCPETPLDLHLAALAAPDLPPHDLVCVGW